MCVHARECLREAANCVRVCERGGVRMAGFIFWPRPASLVNHVPT